MITLDIDGYGSRSEEYSEYKAYDLLVAAETGLCAVTGSPESEGRVGVSICDITSGMNGYAGVLRVLYARDTQDEALSVEARGVHISLFQSASELMSVPFLQYQATQQPPQRMGLKHPSICPYGVFTSKDFKRVLISIQNEREWKSLRLFCGIPESTTYDSNIKRVEMREDIDAMVQGMFLCVRLNTFVAYLD